MSFETVAERRSGGQFVDPAVVNDPYAKIPALQWDNPAPPSVTHQMICRPLTHGPAWLGKPGCFCPHCCTVQIGGSPKSRPNCICRMGRQRLENFQPAWNDGCAAASIDYPTSHDCMEFFPNFHAKRISAFSAELNCLDPGRAPKLAARGN